MHTKIVIGVKNDDLFEYEVEKVIRSKAALKDATVIFRI